MNLTQQTILHLWSKVLINTYFHFLDIFQGKVTTADTLILRTIKIKQ